MRWKDNSVIANSKECRLQYENESTGYPPTTYEFEYLNNSLFNQYL